MKLIDMFAGAGFASLGFRKAGFDVVSALEIDSDRCDVYEKNLGFRPIQKDVLNVRASEMVRKGSKFCVVGCPPCQSFSKLSDTRMVDTANDPRSRLVLKFAKLVVEMKPVVVVFENVPWMVNGPGRKFFDQYLGKLERDYFTVHGIINASDVGVPQNRKRVVAISVRKKFLNKMEMEQFHTKSGKVRTVRDAFSNLSPNDPLHVPTVHSPKVLEMIRHVPKDGGNRKSIPRRLWLDCHKKLKNGASSSYGRMWWDRPSPTITGRCTTPACGRFIHPELDRAITLREAARLQMIPDWYDFGGISTGKIQRMIGDGVPVELARHIGKNILRVFNEYA